MSLLPWKRNQPAPVTTPLSQVSPLQRDMQRMFDRFFSGFPSVTGFPTGFEGFSSYPPVSVSDTGDALLVRAEVPGMQPDDLEINVEGNSLTLRGEKREEAREENESCFVSECSYGAFMRRLDLPCNVDSEKAEAHMEKGVLSLRLPKVAGEASRTIKIQAS